jgi:outer membrane protein
MNDKEKQDYANQLQQRLMLKEQELKGALMDKVTAAVKSVAEAKGLSVVLEKGNVIYGGTDITDEVSKKLK